MDENKAANNTADINTATAAENTATSQLDMGAPAASATEQNTAPVQQENATQPTATSIGETDITKTQAFSQRLKESVAAERMKWEQEHSTPAVPEVSLTAEEKTNLETKRNELYSKLIDEGNTPTMALITANQQMKESQGELLSDKKATVKAEAERKAELESLKGKVTPLSERIAALEKENAELKAKQSAVDSNLAGAAAAVGSLASSPAQDKDFYTSEEWDKLPKDARQRLLKDPTKLKSMMAKW